MMLGAATRALILAFLIGGATTATASDRQILSFDDLHGWAGDDHRAALGAFRESCMDFKMPVWDALCELAADTTDARAFFELFFRPVRIQDQSAPLVTGYFEPELRGSRTRSLTYRHPVYAMPPGLSDGMQWWTREEIERSAEMRASNLAIAWVDDPVALFYTQVQGSGRIRLENGDVIRIGYGGSNGHEYRSPGMELVRQGIYQPHQVSARVIASWVRRNPVAGLELLRQSPGYVFFRVITGMDETDGPRGAMNRPLTAGRSIAVDPAFLPLGAPVWLEKAGAEPIRRLVVAQDTGSAIKGAQRADLFIGSGDEAGREAAKLKDRGRLTVLLPIPLALQAEEG